MKYVSKNNHIFIGFVLICFVLTATTALAQTTCPNKVEDYDGNHYKTVLIGNQCWMKENLRTTHYPDGTSIPLGHKESTSIGYRYYTYDYAYDISQGFLYNWTAVSHGAQPSNSVPSHIQGICPDGWHIPSESEWDNLTKYLREHREFWCGDDSNNIAKSLASRTGWKISHDDCCMGEELSSNNATGFTALPVGAYKDGQNIFVDSAAQFWSCSKMNIEGLEFLKEYIYLYALFYYAPEIQELYCINRSNNGIAVSVRCLKDPTIVTTGTSAHKKTKKSCPSIIKDYDGNTYNTLQIGEQCWMRENLRTKHYADGTFIPMGKTTSYSNAYRYYPENNSINVLTYGFLYNWKAVMGNSSKTKTDLGRVQGVCPTGWHIPSYAEWEQLIHFSMNQPEFLCDGDSMNVAKALAATTGWLSSMQECAVGNTSSNNNTTNFSALPAGYYGSRSNYFGIYAIFWSSDGGNGDLAYNHSLYYNTAVVLRGQENKSYGYSVRCIHD